MVAFVTRDEPDTPGQTLAEEWLLEYFHEKMSTLVRLQNQIDRALFVDHQETDGLSRYAEKIVGEYKETTADAVSRVEADIQRFNLRAEEIAISLTELVLETQEAAAAAEALQTDIDELFRLLLTEGILGQEHREFRRLNNQYREILSGESATEKGAALQALHDEMGEQYHHLKTKKIQQTKQLHRLQQKMQDIRKIQLTGSNLETYRDISKRFSNIRTISDADQRDMELSAIEYQISRLGDELGIIDFIDLSGLTEKTIHSIRTADPQDHTRHKLNKTAAIRREAARFLRRIRRLSPGSRYCTTEISSQLENETSAERLTLLRDHLQLEYGMLKEQIAARLVIHEELTGMVESLSKEKSDDDLVRAVVDMSQEETVDRRELAILRRQYVGYMLRRPQTRSRYERMIVIRRVLAALQEGGYAAYSHTLSLQEPADTLAQQENLLLGSGLSPYQIQLALNQFDEFVFRFVRLVKSEDDLRHKDIWTEQDQKAATIWCNRYNQIMHRLGQMGCQIDERVRREPADIAALYIVRPEPATTTGSYQDNPSNAI